MGIAKKNFALFEKVAASRGYSLRKATSREREEDIDFVLWCPDSSTGAFPVSLKNTLLKKSKKRKQLWGWVELRSHEGGEGWLYKKCTFVIYERKNDFVLLFKKDLKNWIEKENIARWDLPFVGSSWQAAYRLYRRPRTKEAIFHLKVSDAVKNCSHQIWPKDEGSS